MNQLLILSINTAGKPEEYDGPLTALGIAEHMKQRSDPDWKPAKEVVISLTSENFDDTVNNEHLLLVEFYTPW